MYIQYTQGLCQSRLSTVDHAVAPATTAIFPVSGFALYNAATIRTVMILYDFCLLPA
jgi:hypothetical protein